VNQPAFSSAVEAALNRYTVAALPVGFSDRLLGRLAAGALPEVATDGPISAPRRRSKGFSSAWARSGRILGSTALFGLVTAAAAASGLLGDPVYIPGVSEALAKAEIIAPVQPQKKPTPKLATPKAPISAEKPVEEVTPTTGKEAVKALVTQLRRDPEYRALPRKQRVAIARAEAIELVRSGAVTGPQLRQAIREMRAEARPVVRAKVEEAVAQRRAEKMAQRRGEKGKRMPSGNATAEPNPDLAMETEMGAAVPKVDVATEEPAANAETNLARKERIEELRERYRTATPEQRARIRQRIRERTGTGQPMPSDTEQP
jgi:hypothetical protein